MTSLAFDIPQASDQPDHRDLRRAVSVLDVLRHPVLDVLNLDTTPATTCGNGQMAGISRLCGPFFSVPSCVTLYRCGPLCRGVHGHIADGVRPPGRSVCTVGFPRTRPDRPCRARV